MYVKSLMFFYKKIVVDLVKGAKFGDSEPPLVCATACMMLKIVVTP